MKKKKYMAKAVRNHAGNAALCAILIMIMLLAIGTAALVVTGRTGIEEKEEMPAHTFIDASDTESTADEEPEKVEEEPKALMEYPEKDFEFQPMQLESVTAKYSLLLDCTNNVMYTGKNYMQKAYPASLTKIMTVIVALENCDDLQDTYKFTKSDMKLLEDTNASVAGFVAGEEVTVEDLLYGAILPSGADATLGLANYVAGSEEEFVKLMNAKVEELGLIGTHFTNASGLHDKEHYTTAMDMAMIVEYAINDPKISDEFLKIVSAESYTTAKSNKHEDGFTLSSIFLSRYDGFFIDRDLDEKEDAEIVGGKTGFTDESGYSLASIYKVEDTYFVCITLKSGSSGEATVDNINITERYLPTYDLIEPEPADDSSENDSVVEEDSAIDVTPEPIDLTDSEDEIPYVDPSTVTDEEAASE